MPGSCILCILQAFEIIVYIVYYNLQFTIFFYRRHWILCVIDPGSDVVYYLDPLREEGRPIETDLRSVVDT